MSSGMKALYDLYYGSASKDLIEKNAKMQYQARSILAGLPVIGNALRSYDDLQYMTDYIENRGLSWTSIKYPTRTIGGVNTTFGSGVSFVSSNIKRLYR